MIDWLLALLLPLLALLALATLPGTVELLLLTVPALLPGRASRLADTGAATAPVAGPLAVLVPAHDEAAGIAATVASLAACTPPPGGFAVIVIADNCTDDTAARAAAAGARVLERSDAVRRGKGYALDFAFTTLAAEPFAGFVVVDADSRVEADLLTAAAAAFAAGADAVQCNYQIANKTAGARARLLAIAWLAFNGLRLRARARLGLSVGILGNGFGLTRATLAAVPYDAASVVEDLEYHLRLVASGRRVWHLPQTTVWTDAPLGRAAGTSQRARWEGGRLRMLLDHGPRLFGQVLRGRWRLAEPLLDLLLLPLAFHVALLALLVLLAGATAALVPGGIGAGLAGWLAGWGLFGLAVVVSHVLIAIALGGGGWRDLLALAGAPFYIVWKLAILGAIGRAARRDATWVRTGRDADAAADAGHSAPSGAAPYLESSQPRGGAAAAPSDPQGRQP